MSQPSRLHALALPVPDEAALSPETRKYLAKCREKLGLVPHVIAAYSFDEAKLRAFTTFYNDLMLGESGLSKLEREMIAVVVSSANRCFYCLVAHGAAVRELSGDPVLGELLAMNYRVAELDPRRRAMLDFAWKLTESSHEIEEADRQRLRDVGLSDAEIGKRAWPLVEKWSKDRLAGVLEAFHKAKSRAQASDDLPDVACKAAQGRVRLLLLGPSAPLWGRLDRSTGEIRLEEESPGAVDILDELAELVLQRGGEVRIWEGESFPLTSGVGAVYS